MITVVDNEFQLFTRYTWRTVPLRNLQLCRHLFQLRVCRTPRQLGLLWWGAYILAYHDQGIFSSNQMEFYLYSSKIPYPLETTEVQTASRRAIHLWTGRDAAHVLTASHSKSGSVYSSYAQTVVGSRHTRNEPNGESLNHHLSCRGCNQVWSPWSHFLWRADALCRRFLGQDTNVLHAHLLPLDITWYGLSN
jgi:hypothetical protein